MKRNLFLSVLAAFCAAIVLSCNKSAEEDVIVDPNQEREVLLTASMGLDTRGTTITGEAITSTWQVGDELQLALGEEVLTTLKVTSIFGNKAMLSGKVKGAYPEGTAFSLYYGGTSFLYAGQNGTAQSAALRAYLKAENVTIAKQDNKILTLEAAQLKHQQAYFQLQFRFGPDLIKVKTLTVTNLGPDPNSPGDSTVVEGNIVRAMALGQNPERYTGLGGDVFVIGAAGLTTVYFAMKDITEPGTPTTYKFTVTDTHDHEYTAHPRDMATGPIQAGRYYAGEWILDKKGSADVTVEAPQGQTDLVWNARLQDLLKEEGSFIDNVSQQAGPGAVVKYAMLSTSLDATDPAPSAAPAASDAWFTQMPQGQEPGKYYLFYKVEGGIYYEGVAPTPVQPFPVVLKRRTMACTAPAAIANLKYTGSAQALVTPGTVRDAVSEEFDPGLPMLYKVTATATPAPTGEETTGWSAEIPQGANAGDYFVWYKVDGSAHYDTLKVNNSRVLGSVHVAIATADAVIANPVPIENLIYNGSLQQIVLPADASDGCKVYYYVTMDPDIVPAEDNAGWFIPTEPAANPAPTAKNVGTYYVWTKVVDESGATNYSGVTGVSAAAVVASIAKADITATAPELATTPLTYNGVNRELLAGAGTITYKDKDNQNADATQNPPEDSPAHMEFAVTASSVTMAPSTGWVNDYHDAVAKNAGTYNVWYKGVGSDNFNDSEPALAGSISIAKATPVAGAPTAASGLVYNGSDQVLMTAPGTLTYTRNGVAGANAMANPPEDYPGSLEYAVTAATETSAPTSGWYAYGNNNLKRQNAGSYKIWYRGAETANFQVTIAQSLDMEIDKADPAFTPPSTGPAAVTGLAYIANTPQALVTSATVPTGCTLKYKVSITNSEPDEDNWTTAGSADIPTGTNAGTYYIWYRIVGGTNYNDSATGSLSVSIDKADRTLSLDKTSLEMVLGGPAGVIVASSDPSGAVFQAEHNAAFLADPVVTGNTITITANTVGGPADVTISLVEDDNFKPTEAVVCHVKVVAAPANAIKGIFSVDDQGTKVFFSKGNLQATGTTASTATSGWTWGFAEHQYSYVGNATANSAISGPGTISEDGTVDLFCWVGASNTTFEGAAQYGIYATNSSADCGNAGDVLKSDWGNTIGAGWRTLTRSEWNHLAFERETGVTVNNTPNARFTFAIINSDGTPVEGLILFPDNYNAADTPAGVTWSKINEKTIFLNQYCTRCTSSGWISLHDRGCVFLPTAGGYNTSYSSSGAYWSSTSDSSERIAYPLAFSNDFIGIVKSTNYYRARYAVRLVYNVPAVSGSSTSLDDYTNRPEQNW